MLRVVSFLALVSGLISLSAYRADDPKFGDQSFPVNSTIAQFFFAAQRFVPNGIAAAEGMDVDTTSDQFRILMLNYSAYDSAYANKIHRLVQHNMPHSTITDFWDGTAEDLSTAIAGNDVVIIGYPSGGNAATLRAYGKALAQYVRQGGGVIFTGTHEFSILQQFGLFDLDFGYFCTEPSVHLAGRDHPVLAGVSSEFTLRNYAYPLDISDPGFVTLADVRGYPVLGYKLMGTGKVAYLGLEYYFDEQEPSRILTNSIRWIAQSKTSVAPPSSTAGENWSPRVAKRSEEMLYAGSGNAKGDIFDLKLYPNPYVSKATLDIDLNKATTVAVEMTDETGQTVAILLPRRNLNSGLYRIEVPNLEPGVYFIQCQVGDKSVVKKIVKTGGQ